MTDHEKSNKPIIIQWIKINIYSDWTESNKILNEIWFITPYITLINGSLCAFTSGKFFITTIFILNDNLFTYCNYLIFYLKIICLFLTKISKNNCVPQAEIKTTTKRSENAARIIKIKNTLIVMNKKRKQTAKFQKAMIRDENYW